MVDFIRPTVEAIEHIAVNMRHADKVEVWAMSRQTPLQSIKEGLAISKYSSIAVIEGEPCAVFGMSVYSVVTGTGVPWLLGTDHAVKHRRVFLKHCTEGIEEMRTVCPNLFNYVHTDNRVSVKWLSHMGFTIDEPVVSGVGGELFHKFHMGDCHV